MRSITIARLKATLSAEVRRVQAGESVTVMHRTTPVALLSPIRGALRVTRAAAGPYVYRRLTPLTSHDPVEHLRAERGDRW